MKRKTAVVFGAGKVASPAIRAILRGGHRVRVATDAPDAARALLPPGADAEVVALDARDHSAVAAAVAGGDLALSLLPAHLHSPVARACVAARRPFLSTSYVAPELRALDDEARANGVLLLNECGLDPGLDHLLAIDLVQQARAAGERILAFRSICGGIPAPESNDNPFGYKLSWSTRGVALAGTRPARYRDDGGVVDCPPGTIFRAVRAARIEGVGALEHYPNGDAIPYAEKYGLDAGAAVYRGTYRWPGWCETWDAIAKLGWLDEHSPARVQTRAAAAVQLDLAAEHVVLDRLVWLGLVNGAAADHAAPDASRLDFLIARMDERLAYAPGEIDLVVLRDEIDVVTANGARATRSATIVARGVPRGDSAMATLVGLPAGIAACLILDGRIADVGVRIPVDPALVQALLTDLAVAGIRAS